MKTRQIIYADEGKMLTNGETYGKIIYLSDGASADEYYEITEEEYRKIFEEENKGLGYDI